MICLFKLDEGEEQLESFNPKKMVGSNGKLIMRREVNIQRTKLEPGKYALVPSAKEARPGQFYLNYYYNTEDDSMVKFIRINGKVEPFDIPEEEEKYACPKEIK